MLELPGLGLAYLLDHFCGVKVRGGGGAAGAHETAGVHRGPLPPLCPSHALPSRPPPPTLHPPTDTARPNTHHPPSQADKRHQLADWRVRPLAPELLEYARTDTHYLLYCYDRLRVRG